MGRAGKFGCAYERAALGKESFAGANLLGNLQLPSICPNRTLGLVLAPVEFCLRRIASDPKSRIMIVTALAAALCACSVSKSSRTIDETQQLSPRVIKVGDPVPKGGGVFKLGDPYLAGGKWYVPVNDQSYDRVGLASWYGDFFHGRRTANGEIYDMNALTAAHPTLPLPAYAAVTNLANNRTVVVRINDRGPYHDDRIIDLSHKAAELLGFYGHGTAAVRVRYLAPAPLNGDDSYERAMLARQPWAPRVVSSAETPNTPKAHMLAAAAISAEWPLVVKKGGFEGRRTAETGKWLTAAEPSLTNSALYMSGR
ncbi:MAG: septal ring lytic transglycosylase RlpA family protein [Rhodomicrobium sp.]